MVKEIGSQSEFDSALSSAGSKLVVVDFHATWCGPCKAIAPTYASLSSSTPSTQALFLKVDVDGVPSVARAYGVSAMPTFLFLRSSKVLDTLRGADPRRLQELVRKHAKEGGGAGAAAGNFPGGGNTIGGGSASSSSGGGARRAVGGGNAGVPDLLGSLRGAAIENVLPLAIMLGYLAYVVLGK